MHDDAQKALNYVRDAEVLAYDTETSGLDWKKNHPVGYVLTAGPSESVYIPIRHGGGGNLPGCPALTSPEGPFELHPFEVELAKAFKERTKLTIGHHLKFDLHSSANAGILLGPNLSCTQVNGALLDEYAPSYSLDTLARAAGVTAKRGDELYQHMATQLGGVAGKAIMARYWEMPGNDPVVAGYAAGDGVSTWELWHWQRGQILSQDMAKVWDLENRLIRVLWRIERRGMKVDLQYMPDMLAEIDKRVADALAKLPAGFNPRSPTDVRKVVEAAGRTDWPTTEKGNPSYTEKWLKGFEAGRDIVAVRKWSNLGNSFARPLMERHATTGRVHATLNQLKADETGTAARLSCSDPNLQQVPKRDKELAKLLRRVFVADEGMKFYEADYSQCLAAGTQVMVPGGTKNIEDMRPGDWVYSYDNNRQLVLKKVTWAGQTGVRELVRVKWQTNGRTKGHLDCTPDHPIRLVNGQYKTPQQLASTGGGKSKLPYWIPVMALRRDVLLGKQGYKSHYLYSSGRIRLKESRVVFEQCNGWSPEVVHHIDGNSLNNTPENLAGMTRADHQKEHDTFGAAFTPSEVSLERSRIATGGKLAKKKLINNHAITHIIPLSGSFPVYDITVEDTHNFIANEVCVHNCEPRLFTHFSREPSLVEGYNATPPRDMHAVVAQLLGVERDPTAKRMNMGLLTGMFPKAFAGHMGVSVAEATALWDQWFAAFPGIRDFQNTAKQVILKRGYVKTLLGRRGRLESDRFAYRAVSKIIQGGNADIIKYKLLELDSMLEAEGDRVQLLMSVHDSIVWQAPDDEYGRSTSERIAAIMCDVQSEPFKLRVPFKVDVHHGKDWAEASFGGH